MKRRILILILIGAFDFVLVKGIAYANEIMFENKRNDKKEYVESKKEVVNDYIEKEKEPVLSGPTFFIK